MNDEMSNAVIELLSGRATLDDIARVGGDEQDLLASITSTLPSNASDRERALEEENRTLREALIREATLRAELLSQRRPIREPAGPRRRRARRH